MAATYDAEWFKRMDPGYFDGRNKALARDYLERLDIMFGTSRKNNATEWITHALAKLTGPAAAWASRYLTEINAGNLTSLNDWQDFKNKFLLQFGQPNLEQYSHQRLVDLCNAPTDVKNRRPLLTYTTTFNNFACHLTTVNDATKIMYYKNGLPTTIRIALATTTKAQDTLANLIATCQELDASLSFMPGTSSTFYRPAFRQQTASFRGRARGGRSSFTGRFSGTCNNCGKVGHMARNCWAPGGGAAGQGNLQNRPNTRGGFQTQRGMNPSRGRGRLVPPSHRIAATTETQSPEGVILPHDEYAEYQRWQTLQNQMPDF